MRVQDGSFIVSAEEMFVLRQGLFLVKNHMDPAFAEDIHTVTGVEPEVFADLFRRIDALQQGSATRPADFDAAVGALTASIQLGYDVERDDPSLGFEPPTEDELRWLAYWLVGEGWRRS